MSPSGPRSSCARRAMVVVPLLLLVAVLGCSREAAPDAADDQAAATTSAATDTTAAPPTSTSTTDTAAPPTSESPPSSEPGGDFGHTAEELASFRAAYAQAFRAECQRIWSSLGGGPLADPDFPEDQYGVGDCIAELDDSWGEFADSVQEAQTSGTDDAQIAASDLADPLCSVANPARCWSYGD